MGEHSTFGLLIRWSLASTATDRCGSSPRPWWSSSTRNKKKPERLHSVRHHAFVPRFERIGDDWYVSITPTFFFSENGSRPHRFGSVLLAGKKKLDRNASVRGQVLMWRHLLANNDDRE